MRPRRRGRAVLASEQPIHAADADDMTSRAEHSAYRAKPEGKSMHGRIVRELGQRIVSGDLAPGDRLPAESELIVKYEVSRPVLREAVRVLVAKGLVVSRQRAGAIVRPRNEWHLLDPDVLYWMIQTRPAPDFVRSLMAVRQVFEPGAAALAAQAATDEQLAASEAMTPLQPFDEQFVAAPPEPGDAP